MDYLTESQINQLVNCAKSSSRNGHRDATAILIAFRHGLRASEVVKLEWNDIDLDSGRIWIKRSKNGNNSYHPLQGDEIRSLRRLKRESNANERFLFVSEQGNPMTVRGFFRVVDRAGASLGWDVTPHTLRHSCGYHLANQGKDTRLIQDYLGHKNIASTVVYTKTNPERFREIEWT